MAIHTHVRGIKRNGTSLIKEVDVDADGEPCFDVNVPIAATDYEVDVAVRIAGAKSVFILADGALTGHVNTGAGQAVSFGANAPMDWMDDDPGACPLGVADVTKLLIDNASGAIVRLQGFILVDATPT